MGQEGLAVGGGGLGRGRGLGTIIAHAHAHVRHDMHSTHPTHIHHPHARAHTHTHTLVEAEGLAWMGEGLARMAWQWGPGGKGRWERRPAGKVCVCGWGVGGWVGKRG